MKYRPARRLSGKGPAAHQFEEALRAIAVAGPDRIYAVGDSAVKLFTAKGELSRQWTTDRPGHSIALDGDGLDSQSSSLFGRRLRGVGRPAVVHRDGTPSRRECEGGGPSDAGAATGDECCLAVDVHGETIGP